MAGRPDVPSANSEHVLPEVSLVPLSASTSDVHPSMHDWREVCRKREISKWRVKDDRDPDRSRAIFRLAAHLIKHEATPDELACVLSCPPYLSKRGTQLSALRAEVSRLWAKLGLPGVVR